ncbi:zinc finger protein-like 1 homolog [Hibiscus syriacus]|uniref:zinc finger protein-like 1 homolog n=1 Tax=Hibiscus syriacus TaxID=106335 RepID=UPI001923F91E|nr:zinc finger protein-like 1 homolog [Hibiscus syriacus]
MESITGFPSVSNAKLCFGRGMALKLLYVIHTNCLISLVKSFPLHTAPAGYSCPSCSISIWPPKSVKDSASHLHSLLKEAIMQTGMEKNLFGNHPPPAFASDPLMNMNSTGGREHGGNSSPAVSKDEGYSTIGGPSKLTVSEITEIDGLVSAENYMKISSPVGPVATTRKSTVHVDKQNPEISYYADDEDGNNKKYSQRVRFTTP